MKIEVVRPFCIAGQAKAIGEVLEVSDALGAELINLRKAVGHVADDKPARPRRAKQDEGVE